MPLERGRNPGKSKITPKPKRPTPYVIPTPGGYFGPPETRPSNKPAGRDTGNITNIPHAKPRPTPNPRPGPPVKPPYKVGKDTGNILRNMAPPRRGLDTGNILNNVKPGSLPKPKAPTVPRNTAAPNRTAPVGLGSGSGGSVGSSVSTGKAPASKPAIQQVQSQADALAKYMSTASQAVQAELLPQLNDLNRQIQDMQMRGTRDMANIDQRGRATQSDLGELFGRLGNFTGEIQKASTKNYEGLQTQTGGAYEALKAALGSTYGGQTQASNDEMNRLGIAGTTPNANDRLGRDQKFLTGLADVDKTAAVTGLGNSQNSFDQLMSMARGNAATEGAVRVGQSKRDTDKAINDTMFELESGVRGLSGKRGDIEATRGEKIRQLAEAMEEKAYGRRTEAEDRNFQRDLASKKYELDRRQTDAALQPQPVGEPTLDEINKSILLQMQVDDAKYQREQGKNGNLPDEEFMARLREQVRKNGHPGGIFSGIFGGLR